MEEYIFGTIAIVIISLIALVGIFLLPCFGRSIYDKILVVLTALAAGTLFSDAMLHILPEVNFKKAHLCL
jgi:solute carrier family 39 (zinc transporter), member 12